VPRIHMFIDNPELYDAIYHFKDYRVNVTACAD
jgi:hypothetical protein